MGKSMDKQEAIDFVIDELEKGCSPAEITEALSRKLGAPVDLVGKFVRRTIQNYEQLKAALGTPAAASPQLSDQEFQPSAQKAQPSVQQAQPSVYKTRTPAYGPPPLANKKLLAASAPSPTTIGQKPFAVSPSLVDHYPPLVRSWKLHLPAFGKNLSIWLGALIVGIFVLTALAAPLLVPPDPDGEFSTYKAVGQINRYVPIPPSAELILGSVPDSKNQRQLDIWYSLVWGTRTALRFGILVVLFTGTFGVILGGVSAYLGGLPNTLVMGFTDAFLAFPVIGGVVFLKNYILVLLRASGALVYWNGMVYLESPSIWQTFLMEVDPLLIAFIIFTWMPYARVMNSVVLRARQEEYIFASRSLGAGHLRLIFRHLIPNSISPVIIHAARDVGYVVLLQAGFTFIGLSHGSEWGILLSLGRNFVISPGGDPFNWWWTYLPATLVIVLFGVGWNLLGDGLNGWLNPHQS